MFNPKLQPADHGQPVRYEISLPPERQAQINRGALYVHAAGGRKGRQIDNETETFVKATRMGTEPS